MATKYYKESREAGDAYLDWVCDELLKRGIVLNNMITKKGQLKGENLLGMEIKLDRKFSKTGNLYIETHEKADEKNPRYVESGINRKDNTWLYAVGDYRILFIFTKRILLKLYKKREDFPWIFIPEPLPTSKGFCMKGEKAKEFAARIIRFRNGPEVIDTQKAGIEP